MPMEVAIFLIIVLVISAYTDIKSGIIPNVVTITSFVILVSYFYFTQGLEGLIFSIQGACVGFLVMMLPYLFGAMGAGDVKLMAALGAGLGPIHTFYAFLITSILGGLYALVVLLSYRGELVYFLRRLRVWVVSWRITKSFDMTELRSDSLPSLRYGVAIAIGGTASVIHMLVEG